MSTAAFGLRPLPALSLTAAVMATTFGGCGCRPAPAPMTVTSHASVVLVDDARLPASPAGDTATSL